MLNYVRTAAQHLFHLMTKGCKFGGPYDNTRVALRQASLTLTQDWSLGRTNGTLQERMYYNKNVRCRALVFKTLISLEGLKRGAPGD
jgi:hypothetical protein